MHTLDHVEDYAKELRGNWMDFECFSWSRRWEIPDPENWAIVYTSGRDSGLIAESNAATIAKALEPFLEDEREDIYEESHRHWACGYIDGYSIRVHSLNEEDMPTEEYTPAFQKYCELLISKENYPILDEQDYSNRCHDATIENITSEGRWLVKEGVKEDWAEDVYSWFCENDDNEIEDRDDRGGYPSEEAIARALKSLNLLDEEYAELAE